MHKKNSPSVHEELLKLHHHEDNLLNSRLQMLLVCTAFLLAAYAQFHDWKIHPRLLTAAIAIFGVLLTTVVHNVLLRTSTAIEWYIKEIKGIEQAYNGPYWKRRASQKQKRRLPISAILGQGIPIAIVLLWTAVFASNFWHLYSMFIAAICILAGSMLIHIYLVKAFGGRRET